MAETRRLFAGEPTTFAGAFPTVATATLTVVEIGDLPDYVHDESMTRTYTGNDIPETIACHNPRCKQGGIEIGSAVRCNVNAKNTHINMDRHCPGHEGSPMGRRRGMPCTNRFKASMVIEYKESVSLG